MPMKRRLSIRLPELTFAECAKRAEREGKEPGTLVRELVESAVNDLTPPRTVPGRLSRRMTISLTDELVVSLEAARKREGKRIGEDIDPVAFVRQKTQRGLELAAEDAREKAKGKSGVQAGQSEPIRRAS